MLQGCGFVDIDTPGQIDGKKMYADEQGFEDVLTGIYATLAKPNLYGRRLLGLRSDACTSSINLPAPGRRHTLYVHFRVSRVLCF